MSIKDRITDDMKAAMRAGERERLSCVRLILAAIKQREVDERVTLDDDKAIVVLEKMIKQRRESIAQFQSGGRADLVAKETAELEIIKGYLPAQLTDAEVSSLIDEAIRSTGAASIKDMGKVMGAVRQKAQGRTDMGALSARIKERLTRVP
jgi:uncharacterized protein